MTLTFTATYEGGVLRPSEPLPLAESTKVQVTVQENHQPITTDIERRIRASQGILAWKGDPKEIMEILENTDESQWADK